MSYNHFDFGKEGSENYKNSTEALEFLMTTIKTGRVLNHMNFSGMSIDKSNMIDLIKIVTGSKLIMSVHLNDNGITRDAKYFNEALCYFGLNFDDIPWQKQEDFDNYQDFLKRAEEEKEAHEIIKGRKYIDVAKRVQIYMRFKAPDHAGMAKRMMPVHKTKADIAEEERIDKIVNQ